MTRNVLLTFNAGSATVKLGLYSVGATGPDRFGRGMIDLRAAPLALHINDGSQAIEIKLQSPVDDDLHGVIAETLSWLADHFGTRDFTAVGHRVVHGGDTFDGPVRITEASLGEIEALVPLAPLHQPRSAKLIRAVRRLWPDVPQVASFDTAFHRSQSDLARRFALPRDWFDEGIKRYGFHGLSYKYIAAALARTALEIARGKVVVAHLGSGASLCALDGGISRGTSMSFSTLDGLPMATRPGALDPGVLLYLLKERRLDAEAIEDVLYHRSGLLGLSGISADARVLSESDEPAAREALDYFALEIARQTAAFATTLGGLDGLVFTAGIGEHQPKLRRAVCDRLAWLGLTLDPEANDANATRIDAASSRIAVFVIPTDEEQIIAEEAAGLLRAG